MTEDVRFLDFGASKGDSIRFGQNNLGGQGHGIDIDPRKIEKLREAGFQGEVGDVTKLAVDDNSVNYVLMMHFLEHLPNVDIGSAAIDSAVRVASDFVYMTGPNFGQAELLQERGLRKYFSKWSGHTWEHTASDLIKILKKYNQHEWKLIETEIVGDSFDWSILPDTAPRNALQYDPAKYAEKPFVQFNETRVFRTLSFVVVKNPRFSAAEILFQAELHRQSRGNRRKTLYGAPQKG